MDMLSNLFGCISSDLVLDNSQVEIDFVIVVSHLRTMVCLVK